MKKIVIFSQNRDFFGAQIVNIPMIQTLMLRFPESKIFFFSKNRISNILKDIKMVDEVIKEKGYLSVLKRYIKISPDITISLREKSFRTNSLIVLLNRKTKIGFRNWFNIIFFNYTIPQDITIYRANNYLKLIGTFCRAEPHRQCTKKEPRVCILPGAGFDFKMWSLKKYLEVAEFISTEYSKLEICFLFGEKEKDFINKIVEKGYRYMYNSSVDILFNTIQSSLLTIANDCGPSHIAQISDTDYIILYSDEFGNARDTINEWFNKKEGSHCLVGERFKNINSIPVSEVTSAACRVLNRHTLKK